MADLPQNDAQGVEGIEKNSQYLEEPGWAAFPERHPFHTDYIILKNDNTEGPNTLLYREFVTNSLEETQHEIAKIKLNENCLKMIRKHYDLSPSHTPRKPPQKVPFASNV